MSNSSCCYGAAAQSKSLSVGHLENGQKQAWREAETTLLSSQHDSVHHGYRGVFYALTYFLIFSVCKRNSNTELEEQYQSSGSVTQCLLKCFRKSSSVVVNTKALNCNSVCTTRGHTPFAAISS